MPEPKPKPRVTRQAVTVALSAVLTMVFILAARPWSTRVFVVAGVMVLIVVAMVSGNRRR